MGLQDRDYMKRKQGETAGKNPFRQYRPYTPENPVNAKRRTNTTNLKELEYFQKEDKKYLFKAVLVSITVLALATLGFKYFLLKRDATYFKSVRQAVTTDSVSF